MALFVLLVTVTTHLDGRIVKWKMMITMLQRTVVVVVQPYWMQNAVGVCTAAGVTLADTEAPDGFAEEVNDAGRVGAIFAGALWCRPSAAKNAAKLPPKPTAPAEPVPIAANMISAVTKVRLRMRLPLATRRPLPRFNIRVLIASSSSAPASYRLLRSRSARSLRSGGRSPASKSLMLLIRTRCPNPD